MLGDSWLFDKLEVPALQPASQVQQEWNLDHFLQSFCVSDQFDHMFSLSLITMEKFFNVLFLLVKSEAQNVTPVTVGF